MPRVLILKPVKMLSGMPWHSSTLTPLPEYWCRKRHRLGNEYDKINMVGSASLTCINCIAFCFSPRHLVCWNTGESANWMKCNHAEIWYEKPICQTVWNVYSTTTGQWKEEGQTGPEKWRRCLEQFWALVLHSLFKLYHLSKVTLHIKKSSCRK